MSLTASRDLGDLRHLGMEEDQLHHDPAVDDLGETM